MVWLACKWIQGQEWFGWVLWTNPQDYDYPLFQTCSESLKSYSNSSTRRRSQHLVSVKDLRYFQSPKTIWCGDVSILNKDS